MQDKKISLKQKIGMAVGYGGGAQIFVLINAFIVYYYTNVVGISAGTVGLIILISRFFDGVSDIVFGNIVDHTKSKKGVCRPWIFRVAIMYFIAIIALFAVPNVANIGKIVYVFITYNFANTIVFTIEQVSMTALPTYMTRDSKEQASIYAWAMIGQYIIQVLLTSFLLQIVNNMGGTQRAWIIVSVAMATIALVAILYLYFVSEETVDPKELTKTKEDVKLGVAIKAILQNKYWFMILFFVLFGSAVYTTTSTMTTYYAQYILNDLTMVGTLNACFSFPMMIVSPLYLVLVKKFRKRDIALFGICLMFLGTMINVFMPSNLMALHVGAVLKSIGFSAPNSLFMAMLADTIEYGHWKTGVRCQAILMAANGCGQKIGGGLVSAGLGWAMDAAGFDGMAATQTAGALKSISGLYLYLPAIFAGMMIVILLCYNLDKIYPQIRAELDAKEE